MKNFAEINRASTGAKKNFNLIEMLQGCSKRNGTAVYASNPDGQPTVKRQSRLTSYPGEMNEKEQMSSTCPRFALVLPSFCSRLDSLSLVSRQSDLGNVCGISALFSTRVWKYVAMIFAVLVMSMANVGMAWGANATFSGSNLNAAAGDKTVGSITLSTSNMTYSSGLYASSSSKSFTLTASGGATISQILITMSGTSNRYSTSGITNCTSCTRSSSVYTCTISPATSSVTCTNSGGSVTITQLEVTYSGGASTKRIYMKAGEWKNDNPYFYAHSWGSSNSDVLMTLADCETDVYYADIPSGNTSVLFTRQSTNSGIKYKGQDGNWNQSADITISTNDLFTFSGWSDGGDGKSSFSSGTYSAPTYTISFAANGGSGSMSSISSIACEAAQALPANSFTKSGYTFDGWKANVAVTIGGESVAAGTKFAGGATLQNITSDIALTAQWEEVECPESGTVYSLTVKSASYSVPSGVETNMVSDYATVTLGGAYIGSKSSNGQAQVKTDGSGTVYFNANDGYVKLVLDCPIHTGDQLAFVNGSGSNQICFTTTNTRNTTYATSSNAYTFPAAFNNVSTIYVWRVSSSSTYMHSLTITRTASCGATQPGTISKGTLSACTMRLTASGSPASNNTWYWQESASGTSTSESGATKSVNTPGTYYIRSYYSTGTCWSDAQSVTVTEADLTPAAPSALAKSAETAKGATLTITDNANTNDYDFYVSTSSSAPDGSTPVSYTSTNKSITITDKVAGTTYYAWARAKCGSYKSGWTALTGNTFTTSTVTMTPTLTNVTHTSGATSGIGGSEYTAVFTAVSGYAMPDPTVTIGGNAATSGTDYTWSVSEGVGTITIPANKINGNIAITLNSAKAAPSSVTINGTWHRFPGETITLTAEATGGNGPKTYQWYKGEDAIVGATSDTYTKASCAYEDAGDYWCTVTCGGTESTSSGVFQVKILRLYVKTGKYNGNTKVDYGNVDFTKVDASTATASISLGSNWDYCFNIADGCGHYYGYNDEMTELDHTDWTINVDNQDCGLRSTNAAYYVFTIDYTDLTAIVLTVTYPSSNQAASKVIYFDNQTVAWSTLHYRIGKTNHTQATPMTKVPGTNNLYQVTTAEYNGFAGWHIANNAGWVNANSIYRTYTNGDEYTISYATAHEGGAVTDAAVTVTPTTSRGTGADVGINDNCTFYNYTITTGMKTDAVTISPYTNGTITVNYVNTSNVASNFTSGTENLAHSVILTSITAVPDAGYDASAITINGNPYSANYVVTGATTIAASFTPHTYSITYKDQGDAAFSGTHVDSPSSHPTSHTYGTATTLNEATKDGYTFDGWFTTSTCTGEAVTSLGATDYTDNITLYAKWTEDVDPCPTNITGGTVYKMQIKTGLTNGNLAATGTTTLTTSNYLAEAVTNGSASITSPSAGNATIVDTKAINLNNSAAYFTLNLDCSIQAHDIIKYTITTQNGGLYKKNSRSDSNLILQLPKTSNSSTVGQIEVEAESDLIGKSTLYLFAKSNGAYVYYFEIIRPLKITLDATTNGGTAVDPIYGAEDDKVVLEHAFKSGSRFNGWFTAPSGGSKQEDYYTITTGTTLYAQFTEGCAMSGTMFSLAFTDALKPGSAQTVPANSTMNLLKYGAITGGSAIAENTNSSAKGSMQTNKKFLLDDSKVCVHIHLDCPMQLNDVITTTIETQNLSYTATSTRATTNTFTKGTDIATTLTAGNILIGSRDLYIWTSSSSGGKLVTINISRPVTNYKVTYDDNGSTGGSVPTDATNYSAGAEVTVKGNSGSLAKTNYAALAYWNTADNGSGTDYAIGTGTFSISDNTTLYAKWTQAVTLDGATNGGTDGSATAVWNATALTGFTPATPPSGNKITGYYTAATDGTKVLNADGSFAATTVDGYVTSGKWSRTDAAPTLYARYESAGALTWNLGVNTDATSLATSSKTSSFTEIAVANMTNAELKGGLNYTKSKKSGLTGKIDVPSSEDAAKYVELTFKVADGYKFTPSSAKVIIQPVETSNSDVKFIITDGTRTLTKTKDNLAKGKSDTVTLTNSDAEKYMMGNVTVKIYVYGAASETYRFGTPITIDGSVEEACATMPSFTRLSYGETSYTVGATPDDLEVIGGTNITTYLWKQNTVNDRSGGSAASEPNNTVTYTPLTSSAGTMYYWCEMTNSACGITIKTSAVGITVNEVRTEATVTWTDPASTPNYGGGEYTIKATVNETGWAGGPEDLTLSAPEGIRIYNVTRGTTDSKDWIQANFDIQTTFDRTTYPTTIPFVVSADAKTGWNAISDHNDVTYTSCSGAGEGSSYNIRVRKAYTKGGPGNNYYYWDNIDGWISSPNPQSSISSTNASSTVSVFDSVSNTNAEAVYVRTYHDNIKKIRIYADFRANNMTVTNVYKHNDFYTANSKYEVDYSVIYNGDEENTDLGIAAQGRVDITLSDEMMAANDILLVKFNTSRVRPLGAVITESSSGSMATALAWSETVDDETHKVNKTTNDVNFTITASPTGANSNTLGAITYASNHPEYASVNRTTGEVTLVAAGTAQITATLAPSGCYQSATKTYTIVVTEPACDEPAGTIEVTSGSTEICASAIEMTLTHFEGAYVQWYNGDTEISNGGSYTITTPSSTTSVLTTTAPGNYSAKAYLTCPLANAKRSNTIKVVSQSTAVSAERIVDSWYVKNGRLTPDIALWSVSKGATLKSVAWSPSNATGLTCYARDSIIYLEGKEPNENNSSDVVYTLTATITDACGGEHEETTKTITITHQKNTDKHVLAFVVTGTEKGGFTEGLTAAQTTDVELYKTIAANFDVQATNIYSTDNEKKLKEYYSQFDILCVTDYPNTQTKGVNSKSYVDALGSLIDIRPILTMEAFVSKLDNWKAKGISGTPESPTTRQYSMDLQCKDHEIFSGTEMVKVGEGDDEMYRVSMVDNTLEDYATLDATYGSGTHEKDKNYQYGKKPALQGFTFDATMEADGLLPLGLIDDGAGNDLQVGIERQTEMSARLMVLGINSYAMERLTDDGQTVVINALRYLMKKNEEDIADCSITFVGGDTDNGAPTDWNNDANWMGGVKPDKTAREIRILAPVIITNGQKIHAQAPIKIAPIGRYNDGDDAASGSITIAAGGALIVDGEVQAVTAPAYSKARPTSAGDLIVQANADHQGALIFDNEEGETQATVAMYSSSYWEVVAGKKKKYWSYVALPIQSGTVGEYFYNGFSYLYDETQGWVKKGMYTELHAFEGLGISMQTGNMEYFHGPLAPTTTHEFTLTKTPSGGNGENLIGNSWTAPIQIANFDVSDFGEATATVYVYNTGRDEQGNGGSGDASYGGSGSETPGQWVSVPISSAKDGGYTGLKVIPALNAFQVNTEVETTLTLDYDKLIREGASAKTVADLTTPLRAPKRNSVKNSIDAMMCVRMNGEKTHADVWLQQDDRFTEAFDNGWEATYVECDERSPQFYAQSEIGKMAFLALPDLEGTILGLAPSRDGNEYLFTFHYTGDEVFYLNDLKLKISTLISDEDSYPFTFEEGDTNRFYISRTRIDGYEVPTGVGNTDVVPKAQKFIYQDKLYILRNGVLYDATGKVVK
jgi:uncharacterized repeat protein (TIGR02543 family)